MNLTKLQYLRPGDSITLKPMRAISYGIEKKTVEFFDLHYRSGYLTPMINARYILHGENKIGFFEPSDFQ